MSITTDDMFFLRDDAGCSLANGLCSRHQIDGFAQICNALPADAQETKDLTDLFHALYIKQLVKIDNLKTELMMCRHLGHHKIKRAEHRIKWLEEEGERLARALIERNEKISQLEKQLESMRSKPRIKAQREK